MLKQLLNHVFSKINILQAPSPLTLSFSKANRVQLSVMVQSAVQPIKDSIPAVSTQRGLAGKSLVVKLPKFSSFPLLISHFRLPSSTSTPVLHKYTLFQGYFPVALRPISASE